MNEVPVYFDVTEQSMKQVEDEKKSMMILFAEGDGDYV